MTLEAGETLEPGRAHIIKRPRLTTLLDESKARIILLVAPAGYGKTTLAREWLSTRPHAWYRGTSATADVAALALGLAKAAATMVPCAGERMATRLRVSSAPPDEAEALAELLADDLGAWPADAWLAFDDYQFACDSEPSERFVEHLASSCPIRLLAASRSRPSWATARRLLYGEIYEIGRNLLAMSQEEASSVLENHTAKEREGLIALADGWPALIGLATLAEEPDLPTRGLPDELYNYFAEELYQAIPVNIQEGLRRLSLAPSIPPGMAESLAGRAAPHIIDQAVKLGFFLTASRDRMEFHPLLRSFLSSKFVSAQDDPDGQIVSGLVHTLIEREEWDEAFDVIERFFDGSLLVELVEAALSRLIDEARLPTLVRWINTANSHRVDSPVIDFAEAEVAFKGGAFRRAEAFAAQAVRRFPDDHPLKSKSLWLAGTSAHMTSREDVAIEHFERAALAARSDTDRREALWGRFLATSKLDQVDDAKILLTELESRSGTTVDELLRVGTSRLVVAGLTGRLIQALESVDELALLASKARDPLIQSSFLNIHAALLALGGRYREACESAKREIEITTTYGLSFAAPYAQCQLAVGSWGLRDFRRCKATLSVLEKAHITLADAFLRMNIGALRGRLYLAIGSTSKALDVFERYQYPSAANHMEAEYLAWWSLAHAAAGQPGPAATLADRAESMSPRIEISGLIPWTKAVLAVNRRRSTRPAAEDAFRIALDTGNIDAFVTAYRACPELLRLLVSNEANHDQLRTILERARDHALAESAGLRLPSAPDQDGPSMLTRREREVMELVTQGLSNREIGRALLITESTAKVHVRKICRKLGVRTRIEAVGRMSDLSA